MTPEPDRSTYETVTETRVLERVKQGPQGAQGAQGDVGETGSQGEAGAPGPQGPGVYFSDTQPDVPPPYLWYRTEGGVVVDILIEDAS